MRTKENVITELPNGLPLYKFMQYKLTKEKCQIIKVNEAKLNTDITSEFFGTIVSPLTVTIKIIRKIAGIECIVIINDIFPYDLVVWNESMNPHREVTYKLRRRKQTRTIIYN